MKKVLKKCPECKQEIDPDTCWCGDLYESHTVFDGHYFVPMGCDCFRVKNLSFDLNSILSD
jgi:hypothetical protein